MCESTVDLKCLQLDAAKEGDVDTPEHPRRSAVATWTVDCVACCKFNRFPAIVLEHGTKLHTAAAQHLSAKV